MEQVNDDTDKNENENDREKEELVSQATPSTPVELKKPVLHDKTLRNIGNITYGKLRLYKNHFQKTGELTGPPTIMADEEDKKKFLEFMHSDE